MAEGWPVSVSRRALEQDVVDGGYIRFCMLKLGYKIMSQIDSDNITLLGKLILVTPPLMIPFYRSIVLNTIFSIDTLSD